MSASGGQANANTYDQEITANGRYVTFSSWASNLVPGDAPDTLDVFIRERAG